MLSEDVIILSGSLLHDQVFFLFVFYVTHSEGQSEQLSHYSVSLLFVASLCEGEHWRTQTSRLHHVDILDLSFGHLSQRITRLTWRAPFTLHALSLPSAALLQYLNRNWFPCANAGATTTTSTTQLLHRLQRNICFYQKNMVVFVRFKERRSTF